MNKIKKKLQNIFKTFFYKIFILINGKIKGVINSEQDTRINLNNVIKENKISYKIFKVKEGRLYTDRIHDTAIILDNFIIEGPSHQLRFNEKRSINNVNAQKNIIFTKGTPRLQKKLNGTVLSLLTGGAGNENYSHWLFDVLPRLSLCNEVFEVSKIDFFLLPDLNKNFQKETLETIGIKINKCLSSRLFRHISAKEIIITDHPYGITNDATYDIQNMPAWIFKWLKEMFINKKSKIDTPSKIYIDRSDSESNIKHMRKIINENEVKKYLLKNGFKPITLANHHFNEQVQIFNNAKFVVGLHGAGLANLSFCKPETKVIEIKSLTAGTQYQNLCQKNQLIYKPLISKPSKFDLKNQYGHIDVSLKLLKELTND